ncbi:MAG: hypothetical protein NPINA01_21470 [Nitrospinaceae bacterium]|nr:MAG: hypothetical protein NPINA01_21470 [Nitrospinaceae bacterium]
MQQPKRILTKLLGDSAKVDQLEATSEPLELVAEILRDVVKCRRTRNWLLEEFAIDLAITAETFDRLLDIPQINFIETPTRTLEMEVVSLKETRSPGQAVTVGNLNTVLRELYRTLNEIHENKKKNYSDLLLAEEMSYELLDKVTDWVAALRPLNGQLTGFLFTGGKARRIEKEFQSMFPGSVGAHPLRKSLPQVERELEFYRTCREANEKWQAIGLDSFRMLRKDALKPALENIEELGTQLWNIVYKKPPVKKSIEIAGIQFEDVRALFDDDLVTVNNV